MMLEGTRHEKIIITIAAYVIGLNTAFIAFGLEKSPHTYTQDDYPYYEDEYYDYASGDEWSDTAPPAVNETTESASDNDIESQLQVILNDRGLYVAQDNRRQLVTANQASVIGALSATESRNGLYYDIIGASLSPNEDFIYFCEQLQATETMCDPFVYDIAASTLHRVQLPDGSRAIEITSHTVNWQGDSILVLNDFVSTSAQTPWR